MPLTQVSAALLSSEANAQGFRNRIINGDMRIDQRNAGASVTANDGVFPVDRFKFSMTQSSKGTGQQSTTVPTGFINSLLFTSSSAYSVLSSDQFAIAQNIEGLNVSDLGWGAAGAQSVTLSFWVRSSLTGTFGGALQNSAANRSYPFSYTISAANTWEQKTITIAGDTSGTWLTTNGIGIRLFISLGMGSTFSGTAGAWAGSNLQSATGAVSVVGTNGATFYITGVQLEAGTVAEQFERLDYGRQLIQCQRYYQELNYLSLLHSRTSATLESSIMWPVWMRAAPTFTNQQIWIFYDAFGTAFTQSSATGGYAVSGANAKGGFIYMDSLSGLTQGRTYVTSAGSTGRIGLSAEL